jgi:probable HAF family extracellular repeat protein
MSHTARTIGIALGFALTSVSPLRIAAQNHDSHHQPRYRLVDIGTFGGPDSIVFGFNDNLNKDRPLLTNCADTTQLDPDDPDTNPLFNGDPYIQHSYRWSSGRLTDLGTLPGGTSSCGQGINVFGSVAGFSTNGAFDPLTGAPEVEAVLWRDREIINLGTLGGNNGFAVGINDRGQIAGSANNSIPDPFAGALVPIGATQLHAFLWEDDAMRDLGTLGGPDSAAAFLNQRGEVAGNSFTSSTPNATTGIPTIDPFLWTHGRMLDLGTLGGTFGAPIGLNNGGQVVGASNLAGDQTAHPFLWDRGKLKDLGTLGGSYGQANGINDDDLVVGFAYVAGDSHVDAFLWENGKMTDLGNPGCDSSGSAINSKGQIVGTGLLAGCSDRRALLWQDGKRYDLNDLIPSGSGFVVRVAWYINEEGVIAGEGEQKVCNDPDGCFHGFLLFPMQQ